MLDHRVGKHGGGERSQLARRNEIGAGQFRVEPAGEPGGDVQALVALVAVVDMDEKGSIVHGALDR